MDTKRDHTSHQKDTTLESTSDALDAVMDTLEKRSVALLEKHDIGDSIKEVKEIEFSNDLPELRVALIDQYYKVSTMLTMDRKDPLHHPYWELWSGAYNRHIRKLSRESEDPKVHRLADLLFITWSWCHKLIEEARKHKVQRKKKLRLQYTAGIASAKEDFEKILEED